METMRTMREVKSQENKVCPIEYKRISTSELKSKLGYQRGFTKESLAFIEKAIENFDWNLVQPVHVSYRDGKYYVIDGQHTIAICEGYNDNMPITIPCIVHRGMTYYDEADYYAEQHNHERRQTYNNILNAKYEANNNFVHEIATKIRNAGGRLACDKSTNSGMVINAQKRMVEIYTKYPKHSIKAVECLVKAYEGRERKLPIDIVVGLTEFISVYDKNIVYDRLIETLGASDIDKISNTAKNIKIAKPLNWIEALRQTYNKKRGKQLKYIG